MNILEEIRKTVAVFDPELVKNEADGIETETDDGDKIMNVDNYQKAIDSSVDPEDLNFSMNNLFNSDDDEDSEEGDEVEQIPIPQKDSEENPIKVDDSVQKITRDGLIGKVLAVGELIEVEWNSELTTLEYPEELIHAEDEEELEEVHSLDTNPPIPLEDSNMNN